MSKWIDHINFLYNVEKLISFQEKNKLLEFYRNSSETDKEELDTNSSYRCDNIIKSWKLDLNKKTKDSIITTENLIKPDLALNKKITEYKVVNFHPNVKDVDGAKGAATRLETLINTEAKEGWEYYRMEGMSVEVIPTGCGGSQPSQAKTSNIQLVVFRKNL